jgi:hypothetical protein
MIVHISDLVFNKGYIPLNYLLRSYNLQTAINVINTGIFSEYVYYNIRNQIKSFSYNRDSGFIVDRHLIHLYSPIGEGQIICVKKSDALLVYLRIINENLNISNILKDDIISKVVVQFYTDPNFKYSRVKNTHLVRNLFSYYEMPMLKKSSEFQTLYIKHGISLG